MQELSPTDGHEAILDAVASSVHHLLRSWHFDLQSQSSDMLPFVLSGIDVEGASNDWLNLGWSQLPEVMRMLMRDWLARMVTEIQTRLERETSEQLFEESSLDDLALTACPPLLQLITAPLARQYCGQIRLPASRAEQLHELSRTVIRTLDAAGKGFRWETATSGGLLPKREDFFIVYDSDLPDEFRLAFVLQGDNCDPERISKLLNVVPTESHRLGQLRVDKRGQITGAFPIGQWVLESSGVVELTAPFEKHVCALLDLLEPQAEVLAGLLVTQELEAEFFCGHFMQQWNTMWELEAKTLERVGRLGAKLVMDTYANDPAVSAETDTDESES